MVPNFTVTLPIGRASFEGMIRGWDEGPQRAFSVEIAGHPNLYGIWRPIWTPDEKDFDVEVVSFGWAGKYSIGDPDPVTRRKLSVPQAADVTALVTALFNDPNVKKRPMPFSSKTESFLGHIRFRPDWIL
jgi:hypothetical protein